MRMVVVIQSWAHTCNSLQAHGGYHACAKLQVLINRKHLTSTAMQHCLCSTYLLSYAFDSRSWTSCTSFIVTVTAALYCGESAPRACCIACRLTRLHSSRGFACLAEPCCRLQADHTQAYMPDMQKRRREVSCSLCDTELQGVICKGKLELEI